LQVCSVITTRIAPQSTLPNAPSEQTLCILYPNRTQITPNPNTCPTTSDITSGSKAQAAGGQLIFLAAGDPAAQAATAADMAAMGKATFYLGPAGDAAVGAGSRMKLVVNMVMGVQLSALAEGVALAEAAGLDAEELVRVLDLGALSSPLVRGKGPLMAKQKRAYDAAFPLKHQQKVCSPDGRPTVPGWLVWPWPPLPLIAFATPLRLIASATPRPLFPYAAPLRLSIAAVPCFHVSAPISFLLSSCCFDLHAFCPPLATLLALSTSFCPLATPS